MTALLKENPRTLKPRVLVISEAAHSILEFVWNRLLKLLLLSELYDMLD
jgi:hypothetical protein